MEVKNMLFIYKRKMIAIFLVSLLCLSTFPLTAYAKDNSVVYPDASLYIRSTSVNLIPQGDNGKLLSENKLGATRIVDKLGIITLEIQTKVNGYWRSVDTLLTDVYSYNTGTFIYDFYYYGTPGTEYRTYVEFYVENDGGSEKKIVVSSPAVAE